MEMTKLRREFILLYGKEPILRSDEEMIHTEHGTIVYSTPRLLSEHLQEKQAKLLRCCEHCANTKAKE